MDITFLILTAMVWALYLTAALYWILYGSMWAGVALTVCLLGSSRRSQALTLFFIVIGFLWRMSR